LPTQGEIRETQPSLRAAGVPPSNGPPLSLRFPDSVKQPRAAGSVGLSNGVRDGVPTTNIMLVVVLKSELDVVTTVMFLGLVVAKW
jgi:hypothetical protein